MSHPPLMWTIVCDDVRREVGGKLSYMGIYSGSVVVPGFPAKLAKLCFVLSLRVDATEPPKKVVFRVMRDDSVLVAGDLSPEQLATVQAQMIATAGDAAFEQPHFTFTMVCEIAPFELSEPCKLKMRADTDRGEVRGGTLPVIQGNIPAP
jgi:hypothetical protein